LILVDLSVGTNVGKEEGQEDIVGIHGLSVENRGNVIKVPGPTKIILKKV
jgi:hypothetical protein